MYIETFYGKGYMVNFTTSLCEIAAREGALGLLKWLRGPEQRE